MKLDYNQRMKMILESHRRYNPLMDEWITVSPKRIHRPWQGQSQEAMPMAKTIYEKECYLCPNNKRVNGLINPCYSGTWVFQNDFQALINKNGNSVSSDEACEQVVDIDDGLFQAKRENGECRVICYTENHSLTMALMSEQQILKVVETWIDQYNELSKNYGWVQIFENKGEIMGCSNPHPHGQIWATQNLPQIAKKEEESQLKYFKTHATVMLADYVAKEISLNERVVINNDFWCVVVPYWATWPYETLLLPKLSINSFSTLAYHKNVQQDLALTLMQLTTKYDNLFQCSFPYSMGWHSYSKEHWLLHAHFYPPLLRSASVKKHMVGYEMLGESQRDITAEEAAQKLKEQSLTHYTR